MVKDMDAWASGYVTDLEYSNGFYPEQSPGHLRLTCLLHGVESNPVDAGFTYCELGCGKGLTSLVLAAANPQGRFVAVDFNPAHILYARELVRASGLTNIEFLECGFEELAEGRVALPEFDFITMHGVYSWVAPDVRAAIVRFIGRFLKPGGIAYVSYNCMPGWAQCMPVQRLLFDIAALGSERSDRKMRRAAAMMEKLRDAGAMALKGNPFVDQILRSGTSSHDTYLVHEYLNESWHPLYHADVARELAVAKLAYVGSGDLLCNFPAFMLSPEQREIVEQAESAELRETLLDICVDRRFRLDVFVRGRRQMSRARQADLLGQLRLLLMVPRSEFKLKVRLPAGEADLSPTTYGTIADLLAEQPRSVRDLLDQVRQRAGHEVRAAEIVATLIGMAQALPLKDGAAADDPPSADRLNRALLERVDEMDPYGHVGLVVPALGTGVRCGFAEAFLLRAQISGADDVLGEAARDALRVLASRGQDVLKDGQPVPEAEALDIVRNKVRQVTATKLPVWQKLLPQLQRPA